MAEVTKHGMYYSEKTKCVFKPEYIEHPVDIKCPECDHIFTIDEKYIDKGERNTRAWCCECDCEFIPEESDIVVTEQVPDENTELVNQLKNISCKIDKIIGGLSK